MSRLSEEEVREWPSAEPSVLLKLQPRPSPGPSTGGRLTPPGQGDGAPVPGPVATAGRVRNHGEIVDVGKSTSDFLSL